MITQNWWVYLLECKDKKLYVGIAKNVEARVGQHNKGTGCRFTKYRCPVRLLSKECHPGFSSARKREAELKGFNRNKKLKFCK